MSDTKKYYFTDDTEKAIIKYNQKLTPCCKADYIKHTEEKPNSKRKRSWYVCEACKKKLNEEQLIYKLSQSERDKLYRDEIDFPFLKLAECTMYDGRSYNFSSPPNVIKRDTIAYLITKMHKYDPTRGYKAFSFFSRVAKNYLIYRSMQNTKHGNLHLCIDNLDNQHKNKVMFEINQRLDHSYDDGTEELAKRIFDNLRTYLIDNIDTIFKKNKDKKIVWGLITIIDNHIELVENYNKKALYVILREYSQESTIRISRVVKKVKEIYQKIKVEEYKRI